MVVVKVPWTATGAPQQSHPATCTTRISQPHCVPHPPLDPPSPAPIPHAPSLSPQVEALLASKRQALDEVREAYEERDRLMTDARRALGELRRKREALEKAAGEERKSAKYWAKEAVKRAEEVGDGRVLHGGACLSHSMHRRGSTETLLYLTGRALSPPSARS